MSKTLSIKTLVPQKNRDKHSGNDKVRSMQALVQKENEVLHRLNDILQRGYDIMQKENDNLLQMLEKLQAEKKKMQAEIDNLHSKNEEEQERKEKERQKKLLLQQENDKMQLLQQQYKYILAMVREAMPHGTYDGTISNISSLLMSFKENHKLTFTEMRKRMHCSTATLSRYIAVMKENNWIEFCGYPKNGYFKININLRWKFDH